MRVVARTVRAGDVCADVGAHVGHVTRALASAVQPGGRVVAFEAHRGNAAALADALAAEGLAESIQVENLAVTDGRAATVSLYPGRGRLSAEWNVVGHDVTGRGTAAAEEVAATSLDSYFPPGSRLDFVKIDVEGAEGAVLAGMRRLLREARPHVLVEFHDNEAWAGRSELLDAGYSLRDTAGRPIAPDAPRVYHCVAAPPA